MDGAEHVGGLTSQVLVLEPVASSRLYPWRRAGWRMVPGDRVFCERMRAHYLDGLDKVEASRRLRGGDAPAAERWRRTGSREVETHRQT